MGAESGAAAGPYGITFGTDTSAAGAFLTPGFLGAARNLTSGFAFKSASSFRSLIQNNGLVHQRNIDFGFKDGGVEFHFTGFLKGRQVYEMLAASDVYIMPSVSEPFGISPLEAMQMGVPSIISKQSGCAEILENVIKVDYWDINALADSIYSIIKYPALYNHLREKGLAEIDTIQWKKAGAKVIDIYHKVIGE